MKQGKEKPEPNERVKMAMDHGSKNEINAISTLVGKILPSLFPGIWYYEEGCIALEHDGEIVCVVSPDGSGRVAQNSKPLYAIEIKCPIPGKSFTTPVHYEVPSYYIPQVLSEMKALSVMKTLYISYTTERTTVFMIKHSESKAPMKTSATVKVLREAISKFKKTNIEFLGEFPSTLAISCFHPKPTNIFEGRFYHQCQSREPEKFPTIETLRTYENKCSVSLKSAHNITKPIASEVLMFIMADLDRMFKPVQTHAFPICYGMKRYSV